MLLETSRSIREKAKVQNVNILLVWYFRQRKQGVKLCSCWLQTRNKGSVQAAEGRILNDQRKPRRREEKKLAVCQVGKVEGRAREAASGKQNVMKGRSERELVGAS
jgi:hypothetical protein